MKKPENPNKKLELVIKDSDLPSLSKDFACKSSTKSGLNVV